MGFLFDCLEPVTATTKTLEVRPEEVPGVLVQRVAPGQPRLANSFAGRDDVVNDLTYREVTSLANWVPLDDRNANRSPSRRLVESVKLGVVSARVIFDTGQRRLGVYDRTNGLALVTEPYSVTNRP
jgi:hypothetical protein